MPPSRPGIVAVSRSLNPDKDLRSPFNSWGPQSLLNPVGYKILRTVQKGTNFTKRKYPSVLLIVQCQRRGNNVPRERYFLGRCTCLKICGGQFRLTMLLFISRGWRSELSTDEVCWLKVNLILCYYFKAVLLFIIRRRPKIKLSAEQGVN